MELVLAASLNSGVGAVGGRLLSGTRGVMWLACGDDSYQDDDGKGERQSFCNELPIFRSMGHCCVEANPAGFSSIVTLHDTATDKDAKARSRATKALRILPNCIGISNKVAARGPEVGIRFCLDTMPEHAN